MTLSARYDTLRQDNPSIRIRDAADTLGCSEVELLALQPQVTPLRADFGEILRRMPTLGKTMVLTRNHAVVHEKTGTWAKVRVGPHASLVLGEIDQRMFLGKWKWAFAQTKEARGRTLHSIQFFDAHGDAVMKVYAKDADLAPYQALIAEFAEPEQDAPAPSPRPAPAVDRPDAEIDVEGLNAAWGALTDTHQFFGLIRKFQVGREQALRLCPDFAVSAQVDLMAFLEAAAADGLSIMCFVGNPGNIQIHTGPIHKTKAMGTWANVLDPSFNLHLDQSKVATVWRVRKPTTDGDVNSLELYDSAGQNVALFFGERKEGRVELPAWRTLLDRFIPAPWEDQ
ncbi:MAG: ChuX/HutX family heme-like substrate-binding protein [Myxococcota bacterium]|nr:ChuX/HutX family heme-like substrate-binding protein [Myxococcota bacterium]